MFEAVWWFLGELLWLVRFWLLFLSEASVLWLLLMVVVVLSVWLWLKLLQARIES